MNLEPNYGSSEYSPQAEELFARYLCEVEASGAGADDTGHFEAFCAEHDDHAEELYGLHADWDNVRGLLRQLESRRPSAAAPAQEPKRGEPSHPDVAPEPGERTPSTRPLMPGSSDDGASSEMSRIAAGGIWKLLATCVGVLALGLGLWSAWLANNSSVLAQEKQELVDEGRRVHAKLESTLESREELVIAKGQLESVLDTTTRERDEVQGRNEELALHLQGERHAKLELDRERERLAEELEAQRLRQREAEVQLLRTGALAATLRAGALGRQEAQLWPATPGRLPLMRAWIAETETLLAETHTTLETLSTSAEEEDATLARSLELSVEPLAGEAGILARTRARADALEAALHVLEEEDADAWREVLARLADPERSPAFANLDWRPQCGLAPLGPDPDSGLELFADRRTGDPSGGALVYVLIPGAQVEGLWIDPFLIALDPILASHCRVALGSRASEGEAVTEAELRQLGLVNLDPLHGHLGTRAGLRLWPWKRHPFRPLVLSEPEEPAQASFGE